MGTWLAWVAEFDNALMHPFDVILQFRRTGSDVRELDGSLAWRSWVEPDAYPDKVKGGGYFYWCCGLAVPALQDLQLPVIASDAHPVSDHAA
jgi:hypothetical protein